MAALEVAAGRVRDSSMAVFLRDQSPASASPLRVDHFDRIHSQRDFQSLMQQEMVRLHKGEENALSMIVKQVFASSHECSDPWLRGGHA